MHKRHHNDTQPAAPAKPQTCAFCSTPVVPGGTGRCDRCWELERRLIHDTRLTKRIALANNLVVYTADEINSTISDLRSRHLHQVANALIEKQQPGR